jgi:hypothetical protein
LQDEKPNTLSEFQAEVLALLKKSPEDNRNITILEILERLEKTSDENRKFADSLKEELEKSV